MSGRTASVGLVAQLPESANVSWSLQPVRETSLPEGTRAAVLALTSTWHFAMGRSVSCTARLDRASEQAQSAALVPLPLTASADSSPRFDAATLPAFSFLPHAMPTQVELWTGFNPRRGRQTQLNGLLVLHDPGSSQPVVSITVTAL